MDGRRDARPRLQPAWGAITEAHAQSAGTGGRGYGGAAQADDRAADAFRKLKAEAARRLAALRGNK
jgi:hypothetical protein